MRENLGIFADEVAAFARTARPVPVSRPLDWMETQLPCRWESESGIREYDWRG